MRCLQVDNTIDDLLRVNVMSPSTKNERKRKQVQWEDIQPHIIQVRCLVTGCTSVPGWRCMNSDPSCKLATSCFGCLVY